MRTRVEALCSPLFLLRQALMAIVFAWLTGVGWRQLGFWLRNVPRYLEGLMGMRGLGCFGLDPHIVWEVTLRCNLRCIHCHARGGEAQARHGELETQDALQLIDGLAELRDFRTLVFSGGEPLLREDLFKLIAHARDLGFNVCIATNGTLISKGAARMLKESGVEVVVVGLDAMSPEVHDYVRGAHGAFKAAVRGFEEVAEAGLWAHVNLTASKLNLSELLKLIGYGDSLGALSDFVYHFVPVGRGAEAAGSELDVEGHARLLELIAEGQRIVRSAVIPVASPQYWAYLLERRRVRSRRVVDMLGGLLRGCIAGYGMLYVKPDGEAWPCPFLQVPLGNLLKDGAKEIWAGSPLLKALRDRRNLKGGCGACIYRSVCGGCRARAYLATGDYLEADPKCPLGAISSSLSWKNSIGSEGKPSAVAP
jgi:radical SAM protein with 4Fe4S-binding SPASM domain